MSLRDLTSWSKRLVDLQVRRLKMVVAAQDRKFTKEEIVYTARILCDDYIEDRLIRSGLQLKERKVCGPIAEEEDYGEISRQIVVDNSRPNESALAGRKRASLPGLSVGRVSEISDKSSRFYQDHFSITSRRLVSGRDKRSPEMISRVLISVGELLERRHSSVYSDVFSQLNISILSELTLKKAFNGVAKQIFADGISWAKIVSLFAFTGALAVECVANGAITFVIRLKTWTVQFTADNLCDWIILHDGWVWLL